MYNLMLPISATKKIWCKMESSRFRILEICSNTFTNVDKIFFVHNVGDKLDGVEPFIIEKNHFPHVTLYAVKDRHNRLWEKVVDRNDTLDTALECVPYTSLRRVDFLHRRMTILSVQMYNEEKAVVRHLDLRPLGIKAWGDEHKLHVGNRVLSYNHMSDYPIAFAL